MIVDPDVERYAEEHSTPVDPLFARLAAETRETQSSPGMMVGPLEGRFLELLVASTGAKRILELGTFTGYSSVSMAAALPPGGRLVTCDVNAETNAIARRYAAERGVADRIDYRIGPAIESLAELDGPFDLIFIDADKAGYRDYYEAALPKLAEDGLMIVDNVLWSGRVVEENANESTRVIQEFNEHVRDDPRVVAVILTVRDGITLIRKAR